jgi:DNA adenine methylase
VGAFLMEGNMSIKPAIKWSGSKRSQVGEILTHFPSKIDTYYEPFLGGASVLMGLMKSGIVVNDYVVSDINNDLISLWLEIKRNPDGVIDEYSNMWHEMNSVDCRDAKREYFYVVRDRFNKYKSPYDFMFIMRTTTNGMPRYNKKGEFNNSFHITRDGIKPETLKSIVHEWSRYLNRLNVVIEQKDYSAITTSPNDFMYLDPPYANTKGMYYGSLDNNKLFDWLRTQSGGYALSFDGISGGIDNTFNVPIDLYKKHKYLLSGNSSFKRTIGNSSDSIVYESLYIK